MFSALFFVGYIDTFHAVCVCFVLLLSRLLDSIERFNLFLPFSLPLINSLILISSLLAHFYIISNFYWSQSISFKMSIATFFFILYITLGSFKLVIYSLKAHFFHSLSVCFPSTILTVSNNYLKHFLFFFFLTIPASGCVCIACVFFWVHMATSVFWCPIPFNCITDKWHVVKFFFFSFFFAF